MPRRREAPALSPLDRRRFLAGGAGALGAAALGLTGCAEDEATVTTPATGVAATPGTAPALGDPADAPVDTVVVLMMENRSFDHFLGWLPGANGRQAGLAYRDRDGHLHETWDLGDDAQGCANGGPDHTWQAMATYFADGANDGFLARGDGDDTNAIAYYTRDALPIIGALAEGYTTYDNYFSSMLGPTWPNRMYQLCATTDVTQTGGLGPRPVHLDTAIFDRMHDAGLTCGYYTWDEPITGLFASRRYDDITYDFDRFLTDAEAGRLPNLTFVDPDWSSQDLENESSNSFHPMASIEVGQEFVARIHEALTASPQWDRMVAFMNFDEAGGFFDHVVPPTAQDDTALPGDGPHPDLRRLGFRVPAIAMSPFAPARVDSSGPYEHCSILRFVEWRWGLEPMTLRDRTANNIGATLDFTRRRDPVTLPTFTARPPLLDCDLPDSSPTTL